MPTALIKITQGAITDIAGRSVKGVIDGATTVVFSNGDDTGVVLWTYELLYTPPGSGIAPTVQGPSVTDTYTMATPDKPGCYRVRLTVEDAAGVEDVDIRNFGVDFPNVGFLVAPYQANPLPLPLVGVGAKPDEMNFGGQSFGWDGDENAARRLMYQAVWALDAGGMITLDPIQTLDATPEVAALVAAPDDGNWEVEVRLIGRENPSSGDHAVFWRRALFEVTSGTVTKIGTAQAPVSDLKDGAAAWTMDIVTDGTDIQYSFQGDAGDTVDWTLRYRVLKTH
jgi:hypothetical protein